MRQEFIISAVRIHIIMDFTLFRKYVCAKSSDEYTVAATPYQTVITLFFPHTLYLTHAIPRSFFLS